MPELYELKTADDLKVDALELAGEPTDGSSAFDGRVFRYMNHVFDCLLSGGRLGPSNVRAADWWWARAYPRGVLQLQAPTNADFAISATFTSGSTSVTLASPLTFDLRDARLWVDAVEARPFVRSNGGTAIELREPWPSATVSTARWYAYRAEYTLPDDFVRFATPIYASGYPWRIDVVDPRQLEQEFPFSLVMQERPCLAALVAERRVRFSSIPTETFPVEFDYISRGAGLRPGVTPIIPSQHRRVLSYGAAYLMQLDKNDTSAATTYALFTSAWRAMADEQRITLQRGSSRYGVAFPRDYDAPTILRSTSGSVFR